MPIEILDPQRIQRPHQGRKIEWHCSLRVRMKFRSLLQELVDLEGEPQDAECHNRAEALRDEIRSLPRFPIGFDPERDVIIPVTSSAQR